MNVMIKLELQPASQSIDAVRRLCGLTGVMLDEVYGLVRINSETRARKRSIAVD